MASPAVLTITILFSLWIWNVFMIPLVLLPCSVQLRTLTVAIACFFNERTTNVPMVMTGVMIATAPMLLIYAAFSKKCIQEIIQGAIK